jgi:hypothetical protein
VPCIGAFNGACQEFRVGRRFEHQAAMALVKRSPKRTANGPVRNFVWGGGLNIRPPWLW